ncbi:MAG TPA: ATP-binding protein [Gammaproteobacteria bacterium]
MSRLFSLRLRDEPNVVAVRQAVRRLTGLLSFDYHDQIRITTAVSELVRAAALPEGGGGVLELSLRERGSARLLCIEAQGAGLGPDAPEKCRRAAAAAAKLLQALDGPGSVPARSLRLCRALPPATPALTPARVHLIRGEVERAYASGERTWREELAEQAHELSSTLLELERKQEEVATLNAELGDTNRGVMALYAELDERANELRRVDEAKTRFFSHVSHEFRTPLSSIAALSRLLLEEHDGPLTAEQAKQVRLIRDGAVELLELVSDVLDLAKVEAGKSHVVAAPFSVTALFGALRGVVRPLLATSPARLEFGTATALPPLVTDEGKVTQILRNLLSNAVKFTERGSITVSARLLTAGSKPPGPCGAVAEDSVLFCVQDTGIGISAADQDLIFEEFSQVRHALQRRVRGTGLGLPLCRRLAALLGGSVWVESELGRGSAFYLLVPRVHREAAHESLEAAESVASAEPLLIVSDRAEERAALEEAFVDSAFAPVPARAADVTPELVRAVRPALAVIDAPAAGEPARAALSRAGVPLLVVGDGAQAGAGRSVEPRGRDVVEAACRALLRAKLETVLLIDDDARFRAVLSKSLEPLCGRVVATGDPQAALAAAACGGIDCAVLDLLMPEVDGMTLLEELRRHRATAALPVLVCSSKVLSADERTSLRRMRAAFLPKDGLDPERLARGLLEALRGAPRAAGEPRRTRAREHA